MIRTQQQKLKLFLIVAFGLPLVLCSSHWINVHADFKLASPLTAIIGVGYFILYLYLAHNIRKENIENNEETNSTMIPLIRQNMNELIILGFCLPFVFSFIHRICGEYQNQRIEILINIAYILIYWIFMIRFWLKDTKRRVASTQNQLK